MNSELVEIFSPFFNIFSDVYVCNRVWSAWSYETMTQSDFFKLTDDDFCSDFFYFVQQFEYKITPEQLLHFLEGYEAYYNSEFDYRFVQDDFDSCWIDLFAIEDLYTVYNACLIELNKHNTQKILDTF